MFRKLFSSWPFITHTILSLGCYLNNVYQKSSFIHSAKCITVTVVTILFNIIIQHNKIMRKWKWPIYKQPVQRSQSNQRSPVGNHHSYHASWGRLQLVPLHTCVLVQRKWKSHFKNSKTYKRRLIKKECTSVFVRYQYLSSI